MRDTIAEALGEGAVLLGEIAAMTVLTAVGILAERAGLEHLASGVDALTVWFLFVGALALYAGVYQLGLRTVLPRLRGIVSG
ncbi:hypothetical protein [Halomicrobium salinisoli]|uniref:hypothetical protein n=1 Tax=Halomicrobium salinisoli TaxID=2878391 RepID=UPI001CEFDB57|nr:hypothetical protein [Halomicrobium salinisoli]